MISRLKSNGQISTGFFIASRAWTGTLKWRASSLAYTFPVPRLVLLLLLPMFSYRPQSMHTACGDDKYLHSPCTISGWVSHVTDVNFKYSSARTCITSDSWTTPRSSAVPPDELSRGCIFHAFVILPARCPYHTASCCTDIMGNCQACLRRVTSKQERLKSKHGPYALLSTDGTKRGHREKGENNTLATHKTKMDISSSSLEKASPNAAEEDPARQRLEYSHLPLEVAIETSMPRS